MSRWQDPAQRAWLREQLVDAAQTPLVNMFRHPGGADQASFAVLAQAAEALESGKWNEHDYNGALQQTVWRAIKLVSDADGPDRRYSSLSWREIGLTLFGFENVEAAGEGKKPKSYNRQRQALVDRSVQGWSDSTYKREVFGPFFNLLADTLASLVAEHLDADPVSLPRTISDVEVTTRQTDLTLRKAIDLTGELIVVDRAEYVDKVRAAIDSGKKIVCLYGPPGSGKTTLAAQAATNVGSDRVITLRIGDNAVLLVDLIEALIFEGFDPTDWSDPYCRVTLRRHLAEKTKAQVVVLDNVSDLATLWQLATPDTTVPIIATSRTPLSYPGIENIELTDFTMEQAVGFSKANLIACTDAAARSLSEATGFSPLALSLAVHFLRQSPEVEVRDLVRAIDTDIAVGLDMLAVSFDHEPSLVRLYQQVLDPILNDDLTIEVLDACLAVGGSTGTTEFPVVEFLLRQSPAFHNRAHLHAGVRKLVGLGLVRTQDRRIIMHQLGYEVLRHLRGLPVLQAESRFVKGLFSTTPEVFGSWSDRGNLLSVHKQGVMRGRHLKEGWDCLHVIDEVTWIAIRRREQVEVIARYEVRYSSFFEVDCLTGLRRELPISEIYQLSDAMYRYCVVGAAIHVKMVGEIDRLSRQRGIQLDGKVHPLDSPTVVNMIRTIAPLEYWSEEDLRNNIWELSQSNYITEVDSLFTTVQVADFFRGRLVRRNR